MLISLLLKEATILTFLGDQIGGKNRGEVEFSGRLTVVAKTWGERPRKIVKTEIPKPIISSTIPTDRSFESLIKL